MASTPTVVLAHESQSPRKVRSMVSPGTWLYLASDHERMTQWQDALGGDLKPKPLQPLLDQTADSIRAAYLSWIDRLTSHHKDRDSWWLTLLEERNTLTDPFFTLVTYLAVTRTLVDEGLVPCLVVAQSWGLMGSLRDLFVARGFKVAMPGATSSLMLWAREASAALVRLAFFVLHWWAFRKLLAIWSRGAAYDLSPRPSVVVMNFVLDADLGKPDFRDRFFPGLAEFLTERGVRVWSLPLLPGRTRMPEKYRLMRSPHTQFLVPEDFLRIGDYVGAVRTSFAVGRLPLAEPEMAGLPMRSLVREERRRQMTSNAPRIAYLFSRLPYRLAAAGLKPSKVFTWAENQVHDRALIRSGRRAFGEAEMDGIQNAPFYPNLLNTFPTPLEVTLGAAPDRVLCSGPVAAQLLHERSGLRTESWCALRYQYLRRLDPRPQPAYPFRRILVALPITTPAALELIDLVEPVRRAHADLGWWLKIHPNSNVLRHSRIAGLSRGFEMAEGALGEWLGRVDVVITAGSGTALEAVAAGVPVVLSGSQTQLTMNPLAWFGSELAEPAYTSREIEARLTASRSPRTDEMATKVLDGWFGEVTVEKLSRLLEKS